MNVTLIRQLMREKKIGNKALAAKSGIPLGTLNKLIYGYTENPSLQTMQAIADALGCTLDELADNGLAFNKSEWDEMITHMRRKPELVDLVQVAKAASTDEITSITAMIRSFQKLTD